MVQVDLERVNFGEFRKRGGVVEETREGVAPWLEAGPVQIAQDGAFSPRREVADHGKLVGRIGPLGAVVDQAIHPRPERVVEGLGQIALPPEAEGQIGIEVGKNNVRQRVRTLAVEAEGDLLRAELALAFSRLMAMRVDPRLCGRLGRAGV